MREAEDTLLIMIVFATSIVFGHHWQEEFQRQI